MGLRVCAHPRLSLSLPGRGLQCGLGRVDAVLEGDNLVVELLQLGFLLLLHADGHVVVLLHHQGHHLLVLRLHHRLRLHAVVLFRGEAISVRLN